MSYHFVLYKICLLCTYFVSPYVSCVACRISLCSCNMLTNAPMGPSLDKTGVAKSTGLFAHTPDIVFRKRFYNNNSLYHKVYCTPFLSNHFYMYYIRLHSPLCQYSLE